MENNSKSIPEISSYEFGVIDLIKKGWTRMEGSKLQLFIGFVVYALVAIVLNKLLSFIIPSGTIENPNYLKQQIVGILSYPILMPMMTGIILIAISHGRGKTIGWKSIFNYYHLTGKLVLAGIIIYILTLIGFLLLILPGIYLSVSYIFTLPLIVDKHMDVWGAMEYSRKKVTQHWFKVFGLVFLLSLIMLLGFIPLGVGLFWVIPLMFVVIYGLLYPIIFDGVKP